MQRDYLLLVTALIEVATGLSLMILPFIPFALLLDVSQPGRETIFIGRIAGAALFSIGSNSWLARGDKRSTALRGLLVGVMIYDVLAAGLLVYAGLVLGMVGIVLWPAVVVHSALAGWCAMCLWALTRQVAEIASK
jgi:hypothetical protein